MIYYLLAIPISLKSILNEPNNKTAKSLNVNQDSKSLYPLFKNTCPRLDCIKVIYQNIQRYKKSKFNNIKHINFINENSSLKINRSKKNGYKLLAHEM